MGTLGARSKVQVEGTYLTVSENPHPLFSFDKIQLNIGVTGGTLHRAVSRLYGKRQIIMQSNVVV